jgi:hypothetical protein
MMPAEVICHATDDEARARVRRCTVCAASLNGALDAAVEGQGGIAVCSAWGEAGDERREMRASHLLHLQPQP